MNLAKFFNAKRFLTEPVDYVDPLIGGISHMLVPTFPTVHLPNSMVRLLPAWTPGCSDWYAATKIYGFGLNMPAHRSPVVTTLMPTFGELLLDDERIASIIDHDLELCTPFHYAVLLFKRQSFSLYL